MFHLCNFWWQNISTKFARKMLMKVTTGIPYLLEIVLKLLLKVDLFEVISIFKKWSAKCFSLN